MAGIAQTEKRPVGDALRDFAKKHSGTFTPLRFWNFLFVERPLEIMASQQGNVTVVYPGHYHGFNETSQHLSSVLLRPVFSLEIFDGDFWRYRLYADGHEVDRFNPAPEYFGALSAEELHSWSGNAAVVCQHWPNIVQEQIQHYLMPWEEGEDGLAYFRTDFAEKAYSDDKYGKGEAEQVLDFTARLGLSSPWDENALIYADSYRFTVD